MTVSKIFDVNVELREEHNFDWLYSRFSRLLCVFDQQDSGNLSFGCVDAQTNQRVFVKYAGARPPHFEGDPRHAIARLRHAVDVYSDLQPHEYLIPMESSFSTADGFALVFPWFENGECLHTHWTYPSPSKYTDVRSPYYRFRQLSLDLRLEALDAIFTFHEHIDQRGYVAIDFYDGSVLYNLETNVLKICDIDFYAKIPCRPSQPPWGSPRYLAPEEQKPEAALDHRTNVFRMGACAFGLLGAELDRSRSCWDASEYAYAVALRAVASNPLDRQPNVEVFLSEWRQAISQSEGDETLP